ncbi:hypothetical protein FQA39_LY13829 [Lamprigera yunnana]|nr:hypothetical protein FQA39_LY13829 [Lamprigera yunnana]
MDTQYQIEECVQKCLIDKKVLQPEISIYSHLSKGSNFLGEVMKVNVKGKNEDKESVKFNLIAKVSKKNDVYRELSGTRHIFLREEYVYSTVFPQFEKFQSEKEITKPFRCYPQVYITSSEDHNETIILEDMCEKGFKSSERAFSLDYNHASLIVAELGRFHALSFALRDQRNSIFTKLANNLCDLEFHKCPVFPLIIAEWYAECVKVLDPVTDRKAYTKFKEFEKIFVSTAQNAVRPETAEPYAVVGHGDFWVTNFLFKYDAHSLPVEVCMLDFQFTKVCSPACDISQLMLLCIDQDVRNQYYDNLIEIYYNSFSSFLVQLGSDPNTLFPYSILQSHLKKFSVIGLSTAVRIVYPISILPSEIPDYFSAKSTSEVLQMFRNAKKDEDYFVSRMRSIFLHFLEYNYDLNI